MEELKKLKNEDVPNYLEIEFGDVRILLDVEKIETIKENKLPYKNVTIYAKNSPIYRYYTDDIRGASHALTDIRSFHVGNIHGSSLIDNKGHVFKFYENRGKWEII